MLSYVLPTHNRPERLRATLEKLSALDGAKHAQAGGGELIVVDNASGAPAQAPARLENGLPARVIRLDSNVGAAARNHGVQASAGDWIVMLDDDSYPLDCQHIDVLRNAADDVAAIGAGIILADGRRESGGLPEVFIGCGVAIRRCAFLDAGGYDPAFDYYAEEYDLCAKLLLNGWRIVHDFRFRVRHEKVAAGRDMNRILRRLVRNNGWVAQRYAPDEQRDAELSETVSRYAKISVKENASLGFAEGMGDLLTSLNRQPRRAMTREQFERFTGLAHAREWLAGSESLRRARSVAIVDEGKNAWAIRQALGEMGVTVTQDEVNAELLVIGTLSPGPMLDSFERRRAEGQNVLVSWSPMHRPSGAEFVPAP